jgi:hypothetical protein
MTEAPLAPRLELTRPPQTDDELWHVVKALWGIELPRQQVCPGHVAPFTAFAHAYFATYPNWALWYGSRGTGKSYMLALLGLTKAAILEINVTLLGGSMAQSQNVQEHVENLLLYPGAPTWAVASQIQTEITFTGGNWIRPLPASQKTVRGPHPQMTLLDEIDEMDIKVYEAAMGQAMAKPNARGITVPEMVVASSTWQNPLGTFNEVKRRAEANGLPVFTWCWKEVLRTEENSSGWMDPAFIERKRQSVPAEMFRVEYDLGEPAGGSRAFDLTKLEAAFVDMPTCDESHKGSDDVWVFEEPEAMGIYAAGADWAKEQDWTIIVVTRTDVTPRRVVYMRKVGRRPWPEMIDMFNEVTTRYQAVSAHDATGLGNVVHDLVDERTMKVVMSGRDRTRLLNEYITAVEQGVYQLPRNTSAYSAHKGTTVEMVYSMGMKAGHLPDEVAAYAIMHRAAERMAPPAAGEGVKKDARVSSKFLDLQPEPLPLPTVGEVSVVEEGPDGVFWL